MKNGTFVIIIDKDGKKVAAVLRADRQYVNLEDLPINDVIGYNGKSCQYMIRGDRKVVNIDGKNIYNQQR